MTYEELLGMCKRAVSASPEAGVENLLDVVQLLNSHNVFTRQIACERLVFLLAEYLEASGQQSLRAVKH